jgi:transposase
MNGKFFANFIKNNFNICYAKPGSKHGGKRLFVMDNDPSQSSKAAMNALRSVESELLKIPARSPDLNPIENIFHIVKFNLQ